MKHVIESRWFALADLALVSFCMVVWYLWPPVGRWLLLIALIPWFARVTVGSFPFKRTQLDLFLVIFIITAAIGVWAAYDRTSAWVKFWLIIWAVLLYYAIVGQPHKNLWLVVGLLCVFNALLAGYFLLTNDWTVQRTDIGMLNQLALWWMTVRPTLSANGPHPNIVGGLLAAFAPLTFVLGWLAWQKESWAIGLLAGITGALILAGLLLTSSRAAWLALAIALGIWLLWLLSGYVADLISWKRSFIFILAFLSGLVVTFWLVTFIPAGFVGLLDRLPGPEHTAGRLEIARDSLKLMADFPITGGGLTAFAGLYSHYMRVIPFFLFSYSHNLFLDVILEQGLFGLLTFLIILGVSFWSLLDGQDHGTIRWAILAGLIVVIIHGLADDSFYGGRGTPLLFTLPGLAIAITYRERDSEGKKPLANPGRQVRRRWQIAISLLILFIFAYAFRKPLVSEWFANLGAVHMSRYELVDFPSGKWDERQDLVALESAKDYFGRSLQLNPINFTAQHRQGLIAMRANDFYGAQSYLEKAYLVDPEHRGLRKVLGYNYVWTGQLENATRLLVDIPEAESELKAYYGWWNSQGREDLSTLSVRMVEILDKLNADQQ